MICDVCGTTEAAFLLGNLSTGDQVAFCGPDLARFGLDTAKAGLPPEEILAVLNIPVGGIVDGAVTEPQGGRKSKVRGKAKATPAEDPGEAPGAPEMASAPADE